MSLLMIHKAHMPVYKVFSADGSTRGSTRGPRGPKTDTDCQESGHKNTNASAKIFIIDTKIILIA